MDRDDVMQAIEIALGDTISGEGFKRRTVRDGDVSRLAARLRRILAELDPGTTVQELIEALDE